MATPYSIIINMSAETANDLKNGNFSLFGFKAVSTAAPSGAAPLVWFTSQAFGLQVSVNWSEQYEAYTSTQQIEAGVTILASNSYPADLGQQLKVSQASGTGTVVNGDTPTAIEILNVSGTQLTCGIGQMVNGAANPLCAFPLYGEGMDIIAPIEKVMLTFANKQVNTGSVIEQAFSQGVLLDLTANHNATITFDINAGWSQPNVPMSLIQPGATLVPFLIEGSTTLAKSLQAADAK